MNKRDSTPSPILQRPAKDDKQAWKAYWKEQGQPWRTEPEIDVERQKYFDERRGIEPDIEQGIYPFKDIKLTRADIEWLLATHENGRGPVDWSDKSHHEREGLDLRGADLREVDLSGLPMARAHLGLTFKERMLTIRKHHVLAGAHLERANLSYSHLEDATFRNAHLQEADLDSAHLENADLAGCHLESAGLWKAHLDGAYLRRAFFDNDTFLNDVSLGDEIRGFIWLVDVRWNGANIATINWRQMKMLGEEQQAKRRKTDEGMVKDKATHLLEYEVAVRANRQLAVVLRDQGLNEEADEFAYSSQLLQRVVWRYQRRWLKYILSWFLYLIAGYGYRPLRSLIIYILLIIGFAYGYYEVTHILHAQPYPLAWYEALILSVSSFHGRGFFQPVQSLGDPVAILASIEAVFGLLIEISFIATFTQRFFGK